MGTFLLILSTVLFIVSMGSINSHLTRMQDIEYVMNCSGMMSPKLFFSKDIFLLFSLLILVMLFISINTLLNIRWYWNLPIAFVATGFKDIFSVLYRHIFGYSTRPYPDLLLGGMKRCNLPLVDALITFVLGVILLLISLILQIYNFMETISIIIAVIVGIVLYYRSSRPKCPCGSRHTKMDFVNSGADKYKCLDCGRVFERYEYRK